MGLFGRKIKVFGLPVTSTPPAPIGQLHSAFVNQTPGHVAFEGRFPLLDSEGRYLCKNCGIAFDEFNATQAVALLRQALLEHNFSCWGYRVACRKCSRNSVFSAKDVVTGRPGDAFGPWKDDELELADKSLTSVFSLAPRDMATLIAHHVHTVFFLYR